MLENCHDLSTNRILPIGNVLILNVFQIWDTAGQERFRSLRTPFYRGSDICMLTFALDDKTSFNNLKVWRNEFLYYADIKDGNLFPFIVVANKVRMCYKKNISFGTCLTIYFL